jgi:hypothetical protein
LTVTGSIDRKQHRESYAASHKADDSDHLEESKVEVPIEGLMIKDIFVLDASEGLQPAKLLVG